MGPPSTDPEPVAAVLEGAAAAGVDRLIACLERAKDMPSLEGWAGGYVVLQRSSGRWPRVKTADDGLVAEAVDAADDLAGTPRLTVDLNEPEELEKLGL
jgi:hypothetical protein